SDAVGPVTATAGSPGARNDVVATAMSTPVAIDLVANDAAPGSVVTGVTQGTHGRVVLAGARATYTPAPGWQGRDSFRYTLSNRSGSSSATVSVTVKPVTPICTVTITGAE